MGGATGKRELESERRGGRMKGTEMEVESGQAKEINKKERVKEAGEEKRENWK